jgi:hypothetical protein
VVLRDERSGDDSRHLTADLTENGDLRLVGQHVGPGAGPVSSDGEYEWVAVAPEDTDVLEQLETRPTGPTSYEIERRIRAAEIPCRVWSYAG